MSSKERLLTRYDEFNDKVLPITNRESSDEGNELNETLMKPSDELTRLKSSYVTANHEAHLLQVENAKLAERSGGNGAVQRRLTTCDGRAV